MHYGCVFSAAARCNVSQPFHMNVLAIKGSSNFACILPLAVARDHFFNCTKHTWNARSFLLEMFFRSTELKSASTRNVRIFIIHSQFQVNSFSVGI